MTTTHLEDSSVKSLVRGLLFDETVARFPLIREGGGEFAALTLPGTSFALEKRLIDHYGALTVIHGVEKDRAIFREAETLLKELPPIGLINCRDLDFWDLKMEMQYNLVWLDYCGPWCKDKLESLRLMLQYDRLKFEEGRPPMVAVTLLYGREPEHDPLNIGALSSMEEFSADEVNIKTRVYTIRDAVGKMCRGTGRSLELRKVVRYWDLSRGSLAKRMLLYLFDAKPHGPKRGRKTGHIEFLDMKQQYIKM